MQRSKTGAFSDAIRWTSAIMLTILLFVVVADFYTFAYAVRFVSLPIAIAIAKPDVITMAIALLYVVCLIVLTARVSRFKVGGLVPLVWREGLHMRIGTENGKPLAAFIVVAYFLIPIIAGAIAANATSSYPVVKLDSPDHGLQEAIIVSPTSDGVLLALFDRKRNAVYENVLATDDLGAPHRATTQALPNLRKISL